MYVHSPNLFVCFSIFFFCFVYSNSERMTAFECLEHKWLYESAPVKLLHSISPAINDCRASITNGTHLRNLKNQADNEKTTSHNGQNGLDSPLKPSVTALLANATSPNDYANNKENILEHRNVVNMLLGNGNAQTNGCSVASSSPATANGFILEFVDDAVPNNTSCTISTTSSSGPAGVTANNGSSKHQPSLFPDAPTTPKVCRKSSPDSPPSVKTLVKKFQLDAVDCVSGLVCGDKCDSIETSERTYCSTTTKLTSSNRTTTTLGDDTNDTYASLANCSSSVAAVTVVASSTNGTTSTVTATSSCLCGKPSGCCCHLLNCRSKSIVVLDNSIVC